MVKGPLPLFRPATGERGFILEITLTTDTEGGRTFILPTQDNGVFDYVVDWGDNTSNIITTYDSADRIHTYATTGKYEIEIKGECPSLGSFKNDNNHLKVTDIIYWGDISKFGGFRQLGADDWDFRFTGTFNECTNLKSTGVGKIIAKPELITLTDLFSGCTNNSFTSITSGLFDNCVNLTNRAFSKTFMDCNKLISLPIDLFRYNTELSEYAFEQAFQNCSSLISLPIDLFRYNTKVTSFANTFINCSSLTSIPAELFRFNTAVSTNGFHYTFYGCNKLQLNANIFYADGEQSTRFKNRVSAFSSCFEITDFTGSKGIAPDLWNCDFGTETPVKLNCFKGHSTTSLTNYNDIPNDWKGL